MKRKKTLYENLLKQRKTKVKLGYRSGYAFLNNPKYLGMTLSRYKFVSRMFEGYDQVLEIGAGDGFKSLVVETSCKNLTLSDIDSRDITAFKKDYSKISRANFIKHDFVKSKLNKKFQGIYALDVLEHVPSSKEHKFLKNILESLLKTGSLIIGIPSLESQKYASPLSKKYHVNCKSKSELKKFLSKYFNSVYMFSMNDEVLHTGFDQMSHYIIAIATNKK